MGYLDHPRKFPQLTSANSGEEAGATKRYNCVAWAAGDDSRWWWPIAGRYWPQGVPREATLEAFVLAFESLGYRLCNDDALVDRTEKVAFYFLAGKPKHAARQLESGNWTSKLGESERIWHSTVQDVEGPWYGKAAVFMQRRLDADQPSRGFARFMFWLAIAGALIAVLLVLLVWLQFLLG